MKDDALLGILANFAGRRILIVGDVMLDEYIWGEVSRISPEAPVPVVEFRRRLCTPGGAGNTAANVVSLGGLATLGGIVGADSYAAELREAILHCGVDGSGLITASERPTTRKTRIIAHNQQVVRVDSEELSAVCPQVEDALLDWAQRNLGEAQALLLSDYAKGVVSPRIAEGLIRLARASDKPVVVDPKGQDYRKYRGATVVTPNTEEARLALYHLPNPPHDPVDIGRQMLPLLQGTAVLVTRGPDGMSLLQPGREAVHIPAAAHSVYDVTGAGDTVVATLALALAARADLGQAARLANTAAGVVVGKVGTATVALDELRDSI